MSYTTKNPRPEDDPENGSKDIPSILPLAPGGVYAVKWETRMKRAEKLSISIPYEYKPPFEINKENPKVFFEIVAGGYYLGRVLIEVKRDLLPITAENFLKLTEFKCFSGTKIKVFPGNWLVGGDFSDLDEVIYDANDLEFFNFQELLPDVRAGGQSIYAGGYFADENFLLSHDKPGVLTMYNEDERDANGSRFMVTYGDKSKELNGKHVAFGQVVEGFDLLYSLQRLGDARQEGDTFQRVTIEKCGIVSAMMMSNAEESSKVTATTTRTTTALNNSSSSSKRKHRQNQRLTGKRQFFRRTAARSLSVAASSLLRAL
jgi:cyclophilin family peptidyl-prolyl cis-trans isomerase